MASKRIYLIRHGQTDYNQRGIVQGSSVDTSLNETGKLQASLFYEHHKNIPFDKIYTSKLRRTHQSVQGFIQDAIPWEQHEGLNEISWGEYDGKLTTPADKAIYTGIMHRWSMGETHLAIGGGESPEEVMARQIPVWELILSRTNEKNILVCIHGRAIRILLCHVMNVPLKNMDSFLHDNLCLYLLEYDGKDISIAKSNSVAHLEKMQRV